MSADLLHDKDLETRPRTGAQPARAWANRWRALIDVGCQHCGREVDAGQTYFECCLPPFASREEAEAEAINDLLRQLMREGELLNEWLGAFPVSEP